MPPPAKGGGKVSGRGSTDRGQTDRHAPPSILLTIQPSQQPPPAPPDTWRPVLGDQGLVWGVADRSDHTAPLTAPCMARGVVPREQDQIREEGGSAPAGSGLPGK